MTMTLWTGHWHGFGPWTGSRDQYGQEHLRRPGRSAQDEQTRTFLAGLMPPMQTGHWLLRRQQASPERTWTRVEDAIEWLKKVYADNPPVVRDDGKQAYVDLEVKVAYALDVLPRGTDVTWVHYVKSQNLVSFSAVCCPHHFYPDIPCPAPPN